MHILGLCNGPQGGYTETLLKIALIAAQESTETTISWIHVPSVVIPRHASTTLQNEDARESPRYGEIDDRQAFRNAVLDADGIIIASGIRGGDLRVVMDGVGGLGMDMLEKKVAGSEVDERVLKSRVLGFIATGGSGMVGQDSQVLSSMQLDFCELGAKVVDQIVTKGSLTSGVVSAAPDTVERVRQLGRNVGCQLGMSFDEARYLGEEKEGSCPYCHLSAVEVLHTDDNAVGCVTCGARGKLAVRENGRILPEWEEDSHHTVRGRRKHDEGIGEEETKMEDVQAEREKWMDVEVEVEALPSHAAGLGLRDG